MKIYTRTGDSGTTSLIRGKRVLKTHPRIEAYGTIDELISYIGLLRSFNISNSDITFLLKIQDRLMTCALILATDCEDCDRNLPEIKEGDIKKLEQEIDKMEKELKPLKSFILPGGQMEVSFCHIARSVCRRSERDVLKIPGQMYGIKIVEKYLNRLSDYLFVLARKLVYDFNVKEIKWKSEF